MADLRIKTGTSSVSLGTGDGTQVDVRGTRDGAMFTAPWLTALALEGRCFGINIGTGTTPVQSTTAWVATTPDLYIYVPPGTTLIPVFIEATWEDTDGAGIWDVVATASAIGDVSPGGNSLTIHNMRTDKPISSNCTAVSIASSLTTQYSGNFIEFWRGTAGFAADAFNSATAQTSELSTRTAWNVKDALCPPVIVGEGSLGVWITNAVGATGVTGWATIIWAEVPSNSIV